LVNGALRPELRPRIGGTVFRGGARDEIVDRQHPCHAGGGMPGAPDIAPAGGARLTRADVDVLADVDGAALRQVVRVEYYLDRESNEQRVAWVVKGAKILDLI
jgi:hypothetical protein